MHMTRQIPTLILAVGGLLLTACGPVRKQQLDAAADATHTVELRRAASRSELIGYAQRSQEFEQALKHERDRAFCSDPANKASWRCASKRSRLGKRGDYLSSDMTLESISVTGSRISSSDIITNNQEAGVDEGDIVKKFGNLLFVLRRGVLYSIDIAPGGTPGLAQVSRLDVGPIVGDTDDPMWYDEILVAGNTLILLGFNWMEDRSELLVFDIDSHGALSRRTHYGIAVEDYFSGSNYGVRIESDNLLLSLSVTLDAHGGDWPAWNRLDLPGTPWHPLIEPEDVYLPVTLETDPTLHLIARCPLEKLGHDDMACITTGIIAGRASEFYASVNAAYLSVVTWDKEALLNPQFNAWMIDYDPALSHLRALRHTVIYRIPFDTAQQALMAQVPGVTGNQFSFLEHDGTLYLTTSEGGAERIVNLQRIELQHFTLSPGTWAEPIAQIPASDAHRVFRFTDDALWIGTHAWSLPTEGGAPAPLLRQALDGSPWTSVPVTHSTDMLQPVGKHLLALGEYGEDTWRASLITDQTSAHISDSVEIAGYAPADHRSHAINLTGLPDGDWLIGFPGMPRDETQALDFEDTDFDDEAIDPALDLLLYRISDDRLIQTGALTMDDPTTAACTRHCYNWYGNARIFFIGPRIFALSGGVLAEASLVNGKLIEQRRAVLD